MMMIYSNRIFIKNGKNIIMFSIPMMKIDKRQIDIFRKNDWE